VLVERHLHRHNYEENNCPYYNLVGHNFHTSSQRVDTGLHDDRMTNNCLSHDTGQSITKRTILVN